MKRQSNLTFLEELKGEDYWVAACFHIMACKKTVCGLCDKIQARIDSYAERVQAERNGVDYGQ